MKLSDRVYVKGTNISSLSESFSITLLLTQNYVDTFSPQNVHNAHTVHLGVVQVGESEQHL